MAYTFFPRSKAEIIKKTSKSAEKAAEIVSLFDFLKKKYKQVDTPINIDEARSIVYVICMKVRLPLMSITFQVLLLKLLNRQSEIESSFRLSFSTTNFTDPLLTPTSPTSTTTCLPRHYYENLYPFPNNVSSTVQRARYFYALTITD